MFLKKEVSKASIAKLVGASCESLGVLTELLLLLHARVEHDRNRIANRRDFGAAEIQMRASLDARGGILWLTMTIRGLAQAKIIEGLVSNLSNTLLPGRSDTPLGASTTVMECSWCIRRTNGYE